MEVADGSLVAKEEARGAVAEALVDLGQCPSNRSDSIQFRRAHDSQLSTGLIGPPEVIGML